MRHPKDRSRHTKNTPICRYPKHSYMLTCCARSVCLCPPPNRGLRSTTSTSHLSPKPRIVTTRLVLRSLNIKKAIFGVVRVPFFTCFLVHIFVPARFTAKTFDVVFSRFEAAERKALRSTRARPRTLPPRRPPRRVHRLLFSVVVVLPASSSRTTTTSFARAVARRSRRTRARGSNIPRRRRRRPPQTSPTAARRRHTASRISRPLLKRRRLNRRHRGRRKRAAKDARGRGRRRGRRRRIRTLPLYIYIER